jgi:phosphatidylglycerol:prolipoprotein diacylglycerol transferase
LDIRAGGLVFYGGFIGAALAVVVGSRWKRMPLLALADVLAPSIALGYVFGRLGCFMNGCCYGRACDLPWAVRFPYGHETYGQAVHPTQLYESCCGLLLYLGLAWVFRRRRFDGQVFAVFLLGNAVLRFTVEFFRGDYAVRYLGGWATPAQLLSGVILVAGVAFYLLASRHSRPVSRPGRP